MQRRTGRQFVTGKRKHCVCLCVCVCVCVFLTAGTQCNPTRWPEDCMYVDRGRMLYGLWIHFVRLVCLFVSVPVRLSVCQPVCSSACLPLFVPLPIGRLPSIWLFESPPPSSSFLSHSHLFHLNICLTLRPAVSLAACLPISSTLVSLY